MIFEFSPEEREALNELAVKYYDLINESERKYKALRPDEPFMKDMTIEAYKEWEESGSEEWKAERNHFFELHDEFSEKRKALIEEFEKTRFQLFNGNAEEIIEDAKTQTEQLIENRITDARRDQKAGKQFSIVYLRVDENKLYLDPERTLSDAQEGLQLHYDFFANDPDNLKRLDNVIREAIGKSPDVQEKGVLFGQVNANRRTYRTKAKAAESGAITDVPELLAIPSYKGYESALSLYNSNKNNAFIQAFSSLEGLNFEDGTIYFEGYREISEAEIRNYVTEEAPETIDTPLLGLFYTVIRAKFEGSNMTILDDVISVTVPALSDALGYSTRPNRADTEAIIKKTQSFHNLVGVLKDSEGRKSAPSRYPVLNFEGYDSETDTIQFSSPYMNYLIRTLYSLKKPEKDKYLRPTHTFAIKSRAVRSNEKAFENVRIIVQGIEQAGDRPYHIAVKTLIDRNPFLKEALQRDPKHKTQTLKRTFQKTWELLRNDTTLQEDYINIYLPDPYDIRNIPTASTIQSLVFSFPHEGKR